MDTSFTQVVIYIALKPFTGRKPGAASFTQVVIYIALKPLVDGSFNVRRFTQVVIYIALKPQMWHLGYRRAFLFA